MPADRFDESCFSWSEGLKRFRERRITVYVPHDYKGKALGVIEPLYFAQIEDAQLLAEAEASRLINLSGIPGSLYHHTKIPGTDQLYSDYMDKGTWAKRGYKVEFRPKKITRDTHEDGAVLMRARWEARITQTVEKTLTKDIDGVMWSRQVTEFKIFKDWHDFPEEDIWRFPVEAKEIHIIEHYLDDEGDGSTRADLVKARIEDT